MCSVQCSEYIIVVVLLYLETFICHWFFLTSLKTKGSDKNETIYKEKKKTSLLRAACFDIFLYWSDEFCRFWILITSLSSLPRLNKANGPQWRDYKVPSQGDEQFKVCIKHACIKGTATHASMIAPFIADTDIHLHYIYSVRKRDLLISVIDWILSFQWKLWTTPSTRS